MCMQQLLLRADIKLNSVIGDATNFHLEGIVQGVWGGMGFGVFLSTRRSSLQTLFTDFWLQKRSKFENFAQFTS